VLVGTIASVCSCDCGPENKKDIKVFQCLKLIRKVKKINKRNKEKCKITVSLSQ